MWSRELNEAQGRTGFLIGAGQPSFYLDLRSHRRPLSCLSPRALPGRGGSVLPIVVGDRELWGMR